MKKSVAIELDRMRNVRLGFKALTIIEDMLKTPISKINFEEISLNQIIIILYAGLIWEDASLTKDKVIDLVDEYSSIEEVSKVIGEALNIAFGGNSNEKK